MSTIRKPVLRRGKIYRQALPLWAVFALTVACSGRIEDPNLEPEPVVEPEPEPIIEPEPEPEPPVVEPEGPFFDGCQVSALYRDPDSGFPVYRVTYSFDDDDNMLGYEYDEGPNDDVDYRQGTEFDAAGRATATLIDEDGNDVIELAYRYEYFDSGEFLAQVYEGDDDQDGALDYRVRYEADAAGNFVLLETDLGADGIIDDRTDYRYDDDGHLLAIEVDSDNDGVIDDRTAYTYDLDCRGQPPAETFPVPSNCTLLTQEDLNDDGSIDNLERSTFDAEGRVLTSERDAGNDGDPILTFEAEYDDQGRITLERLDEDDNGVLETERTYAYADALTTVHEARFDNESGTIASEFDYTVDEAGQSVGGYTASYDTTGDGALDLVEFNEQDPRGVTTGLSYDLNLDGAPDYTYTIDILDDCVTAI